MFDFRLDVGICLLLFGEFIKRNPHTCPTLVRANQIVYLGSSFDENRTKKGLACIVYLNVL